MQRGDRRLHRERTETAAKRFVDERQRFGDLPVVPATSILLFEQDEIAGPVETGVAP